MNSFIYQGDRLNGSETVVTAKARIGCYIIEDDLCLVLSDKLSACKKGLH